MFLQLTYNFLFFYFVFISFWGFKRADLQSYNAKAAKAILHITVFQLGTGLAKLLQRALPVKFEFLHDGMGFLNGYLHLKENLYVVPVDQSFVSLCEEVLLIGKEWGQSLQDRDVFIKNMKVLAKLEREMNNIFGPLTRHGVDYFYCEKSKVGWHTFPRDYRLTQTKEMEEMSAIYPGEKIPRKMQ